MPDTEKKIVIKLLDKPLAGNELDEYAKSKKMKVSGFSDQTSLIGEIFDDQDDKLIGSLGLEIEPWVDYSSFHPNYDLMNRLRIKLFSTSGKPIGVIEERLVKELAMPLSSHNLPIFTIALKDLPYAVDLEKDSDKFVIGFITNNRKGILELFQIGKKTLRLNFEVKRKYLIEKIASVNSKWGGKIEIKIYEEELAKNENFINILILFAATIKYHDEIESKIRTFSNELSEGTLVIKPTKRAIELMSKQPLEIYAEAEKAKPAPVATEIKPPKVITPEPEYLTPGAKLDAGLKLGKAKPKEVKASLRKKGLAPSPKSVDLTVKAPKKISPEPASDKAPSKPIDITPPSGPIMEGPILKMPKIIKTQAPTTQEPDMPPLQLEDPVKKIEGMSKNNAEIFEEVGIEIVDDLIFIDPSALADFIGIKSVTAEKIKKLQDTAHAQIKSTIKKDQELKAKYLEKYKQHADKDKRYF